MVSSHQHIQFRDCLGWVSWKQLSERLLQSPEVGLVRSKLNHLLSLGGESTLITAGPLPPRKLTTTSSRGLFGFRYPWTRAHRVWKKSSTVKSALFHLLSKDS